jgi:hypothetical protein
MSARYLGGYKDRASRAASTDRIGPSVASTHRVNIITPVDQHPSKSLLMSSIPILTAGRILLYQGQRGVVVWATARRALAAFPGRLVPLYTTPLGWAWIVPGAEIHVSRYELLPLDVREEIASYLSTAQRARYAAVSRFHRRLHIPLDERYRKQLQFDNPSGLFILAGSEGDYQLIDRLLQRDRTAPGGHRGKYGNIVQVYDNGRQRAFLLAALHAAIDHGQLLTVAHLIYHYHRVLDSGLPVGDAMEDAVWWALTGNQQAILTWLLEYGAKLAAYYGQPRWPSRETWESLVARAQSTGETRLLPFLETGLRSLPPRVLQPIQETGYQRFYRRT